MSRLGKSVSRVSRISCKFLYKRQNRKKIFFICLSKITKNESKNIFLIYANFGEQKSNENGIFCENSRMPSDTMNDEKAEFMLRGMDVILARETRGHRIPTARDTEDRCRQSRCRDQIPTRGRKSVDRR